MKVSGLILIVVLAMVSVDTAFAKSPILQLAPLEMADKLGSSSADAQSSKIADAMWNYREQLRVRLERLLSSPSKETQLWAICMIGQYRLEKSVPALATIVTMRDNLRENSAIWYWNSQPVILALVEIGAPSIPAMIKRIVSTDDPTILAACDTVIYEVQQDDVDLADLTLTKALARADSDNARDRLTRALAIMKDRSRR